MRTAHGPRRRTWRALLAGPAFPVVTAAVIPAAVAAGIIAAAAPAAATGPAPARARHAAARPQAAGDQALAVQDEAPAGTASGQPDLSKARHPHPGRHKSRHHHRRAHHGTPRRARRRHQKAARPGGPRGPVTGTGLRTLVSGLHVHDGPSVYARIVGQVRKRGATMTVTCWAAGTSISGNPVWYRISAPVAGYVTGFYVRTKYDPAAGVRKCAGAGFRRDYWTLNSGLIIRPRPRASGRVARLGGAGSELAIDCYAYGQAVRGDRVWYQVIAPRRGYVPGLHLNTGRDPAAGVPAC
jgi:hypothetical protein